MNPLGPLNGKSFGTSMSPWVVTLDALEQFEVPMPSISKSRPAYLTDEKPKPTYEISLKATLQPKGASKATTICESQFSSLYWTIRDLVAHSTVNGCNLRVGDLLATGTISGNSPASHGCLLEAVIHGGVEVENAKNEMEKRIWLEDEDILTISALAGPGVGFGECVGKVLPPRNN
jgi:fumarylacetoacetase